MTNIWFFIIPCAAIAYIGIKIKKPETQIFADWKFPWGPATACRIPGKILFLIGASGLSIGVYAAFKGPVRLAGLTLPQSTMLTNAIDSMVNKKATMSTKYARKKKVKKVKKELTPTEYIASNISVRGKWQLKGKTGRRYQGFVKNNGNKHLRSVTFQLTGKTKVETLTVSNIKPGEQKPFDFKLSLHFWRMFVSGPVVVNASF